MGESAPEPSAQAVDRLVADISSGLYRYALVRLGRRSLAEDAVGETLCRLVEKGPGLGADVDRAHVTGWCVRCMVNVCRELERRPRHASLDASARAVTYRFTDWHSGQSSETTALIAAMNRLSERQREAVTLRVFMGLSVQAVATAMNCADGTVKALTHQGLAALREQVARPERMQVKG